MNEYYSIIDIFGTPHIINLKEVHSYETINYFESDRTIINLISSENDYNISLNLSDSEYEKWENVIGDYWFLKINGFHKPKRKRKSLFIIIEED